MRRSDQGILRQKADKGDVVLQYGHLGIEGKEGGLELIVRALGVHDAVADLVDALRDLVAVVAPRIPTGIVCLERSSDSSDP